MFNISYLPVDKIIDIISPIIAHNAKDSRYFKCVHLFSLISDTDKTSTTKLDEETLSNDVDLISDLLQGGYSIYNIVDLLAPLVNFSVNDHNKQLLGNLGIIPKLLSLVSLKHSSNERIGPVLPYARLIACKVSILSETWARPLLLGS